MDVIEVAQTEWYSLIVFVIQNVRSFRFCFHYCKLNALTIWDSSPVPGIDEFIDSLCSNKNQLYSASNDVHNDQRDNYITKRGESKAYCTV